MLDIPTITPPSAEGDIKERDPIEPVVNEDLVAYYRTFQTHTSFQPQIVYHPCGASDVSPSEAFPDCQVIYADIDEESMNALREGGYDAYTASALEYNPGSVDLLIMINPVIQPAIPSTYVRDGGFILCNDYHGTASRLRKDSSYRLKAIMYPKDNEVVFDTESPNQYWEEIETDEEFKASGFSWTVANYQTAATVVEAIFGETTDILSKYREIIELAKEQARKINKSLLKEDPAFAAYIEDPEDVDILMYNHQGRQFTIPVRLPRKKGSSDSIFVFEKISQ